MGTQGIRSVAPDDAGTKGMLGIRRIAPEWFCMGSTLGWDWYGTSVVNPQNPLVGFIYANSVPLGTHRGYPYLVDSFEKEPLVGTMSVRHQRERVA